MKKVMVVGAGSMGAGIAQVMAQAGYEVYLYDLKDEFIQKGFNEIDKSLTMMVSKGKLVPGQKAETLEKIRGVLDMEEGRDCGLVIEAVPEDLKLKCEVFGKLDRVCRKDAILASSTSSLSITDMASCTGRPDKVIGMHFFNPPPHMTLIEVVKGDKTAPVTYDAIMEVVREIGKTPILVDEPPGFVVNRIMIPLINEAAFLLAEGSCSAEDIDLAMKLGCEHKIGPLALGDFIGLDVVLAILETLQQGIDDDKYRPCPLLREMVRDGKLGRKTGEGFYKYPRPTQMAAR